MAPLANESLRAHTPEIVASIKRQRPAAFQIILFGCHTPSPIRS